MFDEDGTPVPCYSSGMVVEQLMKEGFTEEEAVDFISTETEGAKILWIQPLELQPAFTHDDKPHKRHLSIVPKKEDMH